MRAIKFRGKDVETGEWIYGDLFQRIGYYPEIIVSYPNDNGKIAYKGIAVKPESVGQFTGANDAYGNEIYEGDILHIPDDDFNGEIKGVVMFEADSFVVKSIRSNWSALLAWCNRKDHETKHYVRPTKVIGNTYDNQELLKQ